MKKIEPFDSVNISEEGMNTEEINNWDDFQKLKSENESLDSDSTNEYQIIKKKTYDGLPSLNEIESMSLEEENNITEEQDTLDEELDNEDVEVETNNNNFVQNNNNFVQNNNNFVQNNNNYSENFEHNDEEDFSDIKPKKNSSKFTFKKEYKIILLIFLILLIGAILLSMIVNFILKDVNKDMHYDKIKDTNVVNEDKKTDTGNDIVINMALGYIDKVTNTIENTNNNYETDIPKLPSEDTSKTEEYNSYINSKTGISFKYPLEWKEITQFELSESSSNVDNVVMVGLSEDSKYLNNMRISIEDTPVSITSKEYFNKTESFMELTFPKFQSMNTGEITISGREAPTRMYLWVPETELNRTPYKQEWKRIQQYQVYVAGKTKIYVITFTADEEIFSDNFKIYENILSTLTLGD